MDAIFLAYLTNGLLMVVLPVGLGIYLTRRFNLGWRLWWIGAAGFVLSQVGHIPFNALLTQLFRAEILPAPPENIRPFFNPIVLGLSAGLWEELTRWVIYIGWAKDARSWRKGVLLGAGHGGIEAIILGVLALVNLAFLTAYRSIDVSTIVPPGQEALAQQQIAEFWNIPLPMAFLGSLERALTIPLHIALSVLVLQAFTRRQAVWIWLAVLYHALVDAVVVYLIGAWAEQSWRYLAVEAVLAVFTLISLAMIIVLRRPEPATQEPVKEAPLPPPPAQPLAGQPDVTKDQVDRSRYSS